ncbi:hypothetical protein PF005_g19973 [Phytophthora fragariae]|uniref:Uncharacterized protein n=1 Tax=Phytophthora fragariae TaxID=53985 RepID=A0A6A3WTE1_9STRA|nr:hypothetical protein PF003_g16333 [Phytophthora fragariae]KAE8927946.1 hypothetical protein PF009_g21897 [Phytophthora fragariae]KAE9080316.1 hypothetical protein PF010_g22424 [Phytophthora fragariae]KAE9081988.1 hypothetical protein PF007_g22447 [Phytophthora fragariae]KAE9122156.1 hypothetical protein PF006_g17717 [Phytophthora fragariae]
MLLLENGRRLTSLIPLRDCRIPLASQRHRSPGRLISHVDGAVSLLLDDYQSATVSVALGEGVVTLSLGEADCLLRQIALSNDSIQTRLDRRERSLGGRELDAQVVAFGACVVAFALHSEQLRQ